MTPEVPFVLEGAPWPALLVESGGSIIQANPAAQRVFGTSEPGLARLSAIWSSANSRTPEEFLAAAANVPAVAIPLNFQLQDGREVGFSTLVCGLSREGRTSFLLQLLAPPGNPAAPPVPGTAAVEGQPHRQKLDCALQLARTVALDFNNALTSILGHTSLILGQMESGHPWRRSLLEVEKSASRAAEIANDLGTFSRQEKETRSQTAGNLNRLVETAVAFLKQNTGSARMEWTVNLERRLFSSTFDEAKLQQAFIKILENAVEAMPSGGRITVTTRALEITEPTQDRDLQLVPGAYVCIEIQDNGCGIAPEILPRVFEPFFTTKRGHRGLGLAWVYGILTNHSGGLAISSQPGNGTSVRVYLPAEKRLVKESQLPSQQLSGTETILIVDDEDLLLTMGQNILSAYGYRVLTASSGLKALEVLTRPGWTVDLVITDLVMPGMSGRELVEHIRKEWPLMRILCTSGYVWPSTPGQQSGYLQKPFTTQELLLKVKETMSRP